MWLDSFVVKFKGIKKGREGLRSYLKYLTNDNHQNHQKQEHEIINFKQRKIVFENMCQVVEDRYLEKINNNVGGRPPSKFGQSITINFPFHFEDKEIQKEVMNKIINSYLVHINKQENLKLTKEELIRYKKDLMFFNIHTQPNGSKTQINIVMSEFFKDKKLDLSKKKFSFNLKKISTEIAGNYGHDIKEYINEDTKKKKHEQYIKDKENGTLKPKYIFNKDYTKFNLEKELEDTRILKEELNQKISYVNDLKETLEKRVGEVNKTVSTYLKRVEKGLKEDNFNKVERNIELIEKNLKKNGLDIEDIEKFKKDVISKLGK